MTDCVWPNCSCLVRSGVAVCSRRTDPGEPLSVDDLELTIRSANCLRNAGIVTIGNLVQHTHKDLLRLPQFGLRSLNDVVRELGRHGLSLRPADISVDK